MNERQIFLLILFSFLILVGIEIFYFSSFTSYPERVFLTLTGLGYLGYHTTYKWNNKFYPQDFGDHEIVWSNVFMYVARYIIVVAALVVLILISALIYENIGIILKVLTILLLLGLAVGLLLFNEDSSKEMKLILPGVLFLTAFILMYRWSFLDSIIGGIDFLQWGKLILVIVLAIVGIYLLFEWQIGWLIPVIILLIALFLGEYWSFYDIPFFSDSSSGSPSFDNARGIPRDSLQ